MSGRRYGSDKEVAAVTYNMKEQRCLEKSLQTLTLEKAYSLKLLDLNHRIIRVNYRRLKDRVSKIRSNLSADDISQLRQMEVDGKLKPSYNSVNISGALKIAAAARRLKFERPLSQRSGSAHPRLASRGREGGITPHPHQAGLRRSNSVSGAFIDAPSREDVTSRRASLDMVHESEKPRPFSAFTVNQSAFVHSPVKSAEQRPATTSGLTYDKTKLGVSRPTTGGSSNGQSHGHTHSPFSSHSLAEKDARASSSMTSNSRSSREVKSTYPSDDSIDDNLGEDLYEERRQELLDEEFTKAEELEAKKQEFLRNIDEYLQKTTALPAEITVIKPESLKPGADVTRSVMAGRRLPRRRQMRVDFDQTPTYLPEADYRRRLLDLWKDINRCRYLRVPDELIDLSGIATLAKDQMRLFEVMRQNEPDSLLASAEL